mmetsp:Transcript_43512/g.100126  ORF Transcript_43512/g.100126 Transcript_43512/m.100126 type:complete len:1548 (-) Transcript_43512:136-4779(-)
MIRVAWPILLLAPRVWATGGAPSVFKVRSKSDCYGQEVLQDSCPDLPACDDCTPVDCTFGEWDEWRDHGDCSGLKLRKRIIKEYENECGAPCNGTMTETARTELQESCTEVEKLCLVEAWGEWSPCVTPSDQKTRARKMVFTMDATAEGLVSSCDADIRETAPCSEPEDAVDCEFGPWTPWTTCSESCGAGYESRTRVINRESAHGGVPCNGTLREAQMCKQLPCPAEDCKMSPWSSWSGCNSTDPYNKIRKRHILSAGNAAGKACSGGTIESECCEFMVPSDCIFSDWCDWSSCTAQNGCGEGGQTFRVRRVLSEPFNGGTCPESKLQETKPCSLPECKTNEEDCVLDDWKDWSDCSTTCGKGDRERTRDVKKPATGNGIGCAGSLKEIEMCTNTEDCGKVDCEWNVWGDWSDCTTTCGPGTKIHSRNIKTFARNGGIPCTGEIKREAALCNLGSCKEACVDAKWGDWSAYTSCSATCGSGFMARHRKVATQANDCGTDVTGPSQEIVPCKPEKACNVLSDCKLQDWDEWSDCSATCLGHQYRHREVEAYARMGGRPCNNTLREVRSCAPLLGGVLPEGCAERLPPPCAFEEWGNWSGCTKCGGGYSRRVRDITNKPCRFAGGIEYKLLDSLACSKAECDEDCRDFKWGAWADWSACSVQGGQKSRKRVIAQHPNHCGKPRPMSDSASVELASCTPEPPEEFACIRSPWSSTDRCSRSCGLAIKREERHLTLVKASELSSTAAVLFKARLNYFDTKCEGTEARLTNCTDSQLCPPKCTPVNCKLGDWSGWSSFGAGCTGLKQRFRSIVRQKNECGEPCEGALTETMASPDPCNKTAEASFCDWSEWTSCLTEFSQRTRYRYVEGCQGVHDCSGLLDFTKLEGALRETSPCGGGSTDEDCTFSAWHEWSCCSATCGGGRKQRHRAIVTPAKGSGAACEGALTEGVGCGEDPCGGDEPCKLSEWGDWDEDHCITSKGQGQRSKTRSILTASMGKGAQCNGSLVILESCPPFKQDCVMTAWTEWTECSRTCGGGQQKKERIPKELPYGEGAETCPTIAQETQGCNTQSCTESEDCQLSEWGAWSQCTRTCGGGQSNRTRTILRAKTGIHGAACTGFMEQTQGCNEDPCQEDVDCVWGDWHDWSGCTKTCGAGSTRRHRRILTFPLNNGKKCDAEDKEMIKTCNEKECDACVDGEWGEWAEWTSCTVTCGAGTSWRHRSIAKPANDCGAEPVGSNSEVQACAAEAKCESKDIDCQLQEWGDWHGCSAVCDGYRKRVRDIAVHGAANGDFCQAETGCKPLGGSSNCTPAILEEFEHCHNNPELCDKEEPEANVNCEMGDWSEWSCSATCGRGQAISTRKVLQEAKGTGKACAAELKKTAACQGLESCGGLAVDCEYSDWTEWGDCSKCAGQQFRSREVSQQASNGGAVCEHNATHETKGCGKRKCGEPLFCTWEDWQEWSTCDKPCGSGKRERKRSLTLTTEDTYENRMEMQNANLQQQLDAQKDSNIRQVVMAFSAGAVAFLLAVGGFRAYKASSTNQRRPSFQHQNAYE